MDEHHATHPPKADFTILAIAIVVASVVLSFAILSGAGNIAAQLDRMGDDIKEYLARKGIAFREETDLNKVLPEVDIVYMTRIQKERIPLEDYTKAKGKYVINEKNLYLLKKEARILHPLPHIEEIDLPIDIEQDDPRIAYFRQVQNGLYIRMALLKHLLASR